MVTNDRNPQRDVESGQMDSKEREPSVTTSTGQGQVEEEETDFQPFNWKRFFFAPKHIPLWIIVIIAIVATVIITIKHDQVVEALRPFSEHVRDLPAGWLIPIAILFVISFPPLFGHEIIALLCGIVYGLWIGFGIVSAGTFLGEIGTWFVFKYWLRSKAAKWERTNIDFAALARLTREGGFWIVLVTRFSAIPSHMSTAIFATCGVNFWFFALSTFLTLPKQLLLVYLGVLVVETNTNSTPKYIALFVGGAVTAVMAWYIYSKMAKYKKALLAEQAERKARRQMNKDSSSQSLQPLFTGPSSDEIQPAPANSYNPNNGYYGQNSHGPYEQGQNVYPSSSRQPHGFMPAPQPRGYMPAPQSQNEEYQMGYDNSYGGSEQMLMRETSRTSSRTAQMPPVEGKQWI